MDDEVSYKFQELTVYQVALDYVDKVYSLTSRLPESEQFNLRSQLERATTSIVLNIAEGSTGQSNAEQSRFLGLALRSYMETVACFDLIERRSYSTPEGLLDVGESGHNLFEVTSIPKAPEIWNKGIMNLFVASVPGPRYPVLDPPPPLQNLASYDNIKVRKVTR